MRKSIMIFILFALIAAIGGKAFALDMSGASLGVSLEDRYLTQRAMSGDMVLSISPATVTPAPRATAWTRTVTLTLQDSLGNTHRWFTGIFSGKASIADASSAGTATLSSTTLTFTQGVATLTVTGDAQAWLNGDTDTVTITDITILGYTVAGGTSVETFTTPQ